ncbi:MAG TPA: DUF4919 domain-containing protein [Opitutaceae bacterium]|nr:DUF4919 domain-containing protein [Opitutaceae bacterium]
MKPFLPALGLVLLVSVAMLRGQTVTLSPEHAERAKAAADLRFSYAASKDYDPYNPAVADAEKKCSDLMKRKAFAAAIEEAERGLRGDRYNIDLLIVKAAALRELGKADPSKARQAEEVRQQWMALMDSILVSGDGKDFATAYRVISVDEEYSVLRILQIDRVTQSLVEHDGSQFDILSAQDTKSGGEVQIYFNIDVPTKWLKAKFAKVGGSPPPNASPEPRPAPPAKDAAPPKP